MKSFSQCPLFFSFSIFIGVKVSTGMFSVRADTHHVRKYAGKYVRSKERKKGKIAIDSLTSYFTQK